MLQERQPSFLHADPCSHYTRLPREIDYIDHASDSSYRKRGNIAVKALNPLINAIPKREVISQGSSKKRK